MGAHREDRALTRRSRGTLLGWGLASLLLAPAFAVAAAVAAEDGETEPAAPATVPGGSTHEARDGEGGDRDHGTHHGGAGHDDHLGDEGHGSRLSDVPVPLQLDGFPERPDFVLELGNPYLGTGRIHPGFRLPGGAIWQPTLIAFGSLRTAVQSNERDDVRVTEWVNRLDLFFNLQLSGTERLVVGFRNLDRDGDFTSYIFEPDPGDPAFQQRYGDDDRWREELDADIESLFFEGDFGELFPNLDQRDFGRTDVGFAIGRQPLLFQEGMLIADSIDGVGLTRNTLLPTNTSNYRMTLFVGTGDVHRSTLAGGSNLEDEDASLYALLTSTDLRRSTIDADVAYVDGDEMTGDMFVAGVSAVQRIGLINTSFRLLGSVAVDDETSFSTDGALFFSEVSWTPHHTHDLFYFTTFAAGGEFSSAARGPASGGPLGRAGINFAAVGLGNYGAPLSSRAESVAGGAVGYQKFYGARKRRQLIGELGVRYGLGSAVASAGAATLRHQMAFGRRLLLVTDGFVGYREGLGVLDDDTLFGGRLELQVKF